VAVASILFARDRLRRRQSDQLNMFRAGAALVVVLNHVRGLFFVHGSEVDSHNVVYRAFYLVTSLGHQAVMAFFVLSGYLVGSSIVRSGMKDWSWRSYLNRRLTRLWIVLVPSLVLCALIDHIGISAFGLHGIYGTGRSTNGIIPGPVLPRSTAPTFFGNIVFLQTIRVPTFGTNGALWSLANEFWYYVLFPLVLLVFLGKSPFTKVCAALIALGIFLFVGSTISLYFLVWLLGVVVYIAPRFEVLQSRVVWHTCMVVSLGLCALWLTVVHSFAIEPGDLVTGLLFAGAIYLVVHTPRRRSDARGTRLGTSASRLAAFSFTLYLVHLPILVFLRAGLQYHGVALWQPSVAHLTIAATMVVGVVLVAFAVSLVTEAQTDRLRMWVSRIVREPGTHRVYRGTR
jgi:peptidoglycan/LPS O-acetylase OafA/YrhL